VSEVEELARQHTEAAIHKLAEVCRDKKAPPAARIAAAAAILDRAWGKAQQPVEHSGEVSRRYVVAMPTPIESAEEWIARHTPKDEGSS